MAQESAGSTHPAMITQDKADLHRRSCSSIGDLPQIRQSEILMRSLADVPRRLGKTSPQTLRSVCTQVSQVGVFPLPLIELCGESIADGFPAPKGLFPMQNKRSPLRCHKKPTTSLTNADNRCASCEFMHELTMARPMSGEVGRSNRHASLIQTSPGCVMPLSLACRDAPGQPSRAAIAPRPMAPTTHPPPSACNSPTAGTQGRSRRHLHHSFAREAIPRTTEP